MKPLTSGPQIWCSDIYTSIIMFIIFFKILKYSYLIEELHNYIIFLLMLFNNFTYSTLTLFSISDFNFLNVSQRQKVLSVLFALFNIIQFCIRFLYTFKDHTSNCVTFLIENIKYKRVSFFVFY